MKSPQPKRLRHFILRLPVCFMMLASTQGIAQDSLAFGDKNMITDGLMGKIYFLPEYTRKLPYFDTLKSEGVVYTKQINIPERSWTSGFPGVTGRSEWFAVVYTGYFKVKKPGHYTFRLHSDDGSKLYIDGKLVINNDSTHVPTSRLGEIDLNSSRHSIRVEYFQGPASYIALQLFATRDQENEQIFPGDQFVVSTPSSSKSSWTKYLVYLAVLLLLLILFFWWRRRSRNKPVQRTG